MARLCSPVAASALAALLVTALAPAAMASSNTFSTLTFTHSVTGGFDTITVHGMVNADGKFKNGVTLDPLYDYGPLSGYLQSLATLSPTPNTYNGPLAVFKVPTSDKNFYIGELSFTSEKKFGVQMIPNGGARSVIVISSVPEPGAAAFGFVAAGSVLGLFVHRRRKS